jgi:hypothetical protein
VVNPPTRAEELQRKGNCHDDEDPHIISDYCDKDFKTYAETQSIINDWDDIVYQEEEKSAYEPNPDYNFAEPGNRCLSRNISECG